MQFPNARTFKLFIFLFFISPIMAMAENNAVRVAVFDGDGVGPSSKQLIESLEKAKDQGIQVFRVTAEEIQNGKLTEFDVLVHPGGSGAGQGKALGEKGRDAVREFVREGGGYLGVCGGAYLATNDYEWSLNLIDAKAVDRRHWARGTGDVKLKLSPAGTSLFGSDKAEITVHYAQGPLLGRREWDDPDVPDYESLAIFATEIAKKGAPQGVMIGTSAAVRCLYGKGRVFCFSPHPELTEGQGHLIPLAARWTSEKGK